MSGCNAPPRHFTSILPRDVGSRSLNLGATLPLPDQPFEYAKASLMVAETDIVATLVADEARDDVCPEGLRFLRLTLAHSNFPLVLVRRDFGDAVLRARAVDDAVLRPVASVAP